MTIASSGIGARPIVSNARINSGQPVPQAQSISYVGASASTSASGSVTVTLPAGIAVGDFSIISIGQQGVGGTVSTPSGWTLVSGSTANTNNTIASFFRVYVAGDPTSITVTATDASVSGWLMALRGAAAISAVNLSTLSFGNTPPSISVTPTMSNSWLLYAITTGTQNALMTPPAGMTQPTEISIGTGRRCGIRRFPSVGRGFGDGGHAGHWCGFRYCQRYGRHVRGRACRCYECWSSSNPRIGNDQRARVSCRDGCRWNFGRIDSHGEGRRLKHRFDGHVRPYRSRSGLSVRSG